MKRKISVFLSIIMILNILFNINLGKIDFGIVKVKGAINSKFDRGYDQLTEEDKNNIKINFGVSENQLIQGNDMGLNIDETIELNGFMGSLGYTSDESKLIVKSGKLVKSRVIRDSYRMLDYIRNSARSDKLKEEAKQYIIEGIDVKKISTAFDVAEKLGGTIDDFIDMEGKNDYKLRVLKNTLSDYEFLALEIITDHNMIDVDKLYNWCNVNETKPSKILNILSPNLGAQEDEKHESNLVYAPIQSINSDNESISLSTGGLNLEFNSGALPGKNGLDVSIGINYRSDLANNKDIKTKVEYYPDTDYYVDYIKYIEADGKIFEYKSGREFFETRQQANNFLNNGFRYNGSFYKLIKKTESYYKHYNDVTKVESECDHDLDSYDIDVVAYDTKKMYRKGSSTTEIIRLYGKDHIFHKDISYDCETVDVTDSGIDGDIVSYEDGNYGNKEYTIDETHLEKTNKLGLGWSFNFSSIEIDKDNKILYLGNGQTFMIDFSQGGSHLKKYDKLDMSINRDQGSFQNGSKISKYVLQYKDGDKEYFDEEGKLIGIKDRYGNVIKFTHTNNETQIVDTLNRVIRIKYDQPTSYSSVSGAKEVRVEFPDYGRISYVLEPIDSLNMDYKLVCIVDQENRKTTLDYYVHNVKESLLSRYPSINIKYAYVKDITYESTGGKTLYEYEKTEGNNGNLGKKEYYRVKSRREQTSDNKQHNIITYRYSGNYTGYGEYYDPNNLPDSFKYKTTVVNSKNVSKEYTFTNKHLIDEMILKSGSVIKSKEKTEYDDLKQPKKKTIIYYNSSGQEARKIETETKYDKYGDLIEAINERGLKTSFEYNQKHHILKKSITEISTNKKHILNNVINESNGNVNQISEYIDHGGTKKEKYIKEYKYYDTGHAKNNLKSEMVRLDNGKTTEVIFEYGNQFKGAYPTRKTVKFTRYNSNKQLESASTIKDYDYYLNTGALRSETTNNKITYKYEYDKLGRTTKVENETAGTTSIIQFNDNGNEVTHIGENGYTTRTIYDSIGRKIKTKEKIVKDSSGVNLKTGEKVDSNEEWDTIETIVYNSHGEVDNITDAIGNVTSFEYDFLGRTVKTKYSDGNYDMVIYYDDTNTKEYYLNTTKEKTEYYDITGNLIKTRVYPYANNDSVYNETIYEFNKLNQNVRVTEPKGYVTNYRYDDFGRLERVIAANEGATVYEYDKADNLTKMTTDGGSVITKEYDELGRVIKETNSLNKSEYLAYNNLGQVMYKWDKGGSKTSFIYDNRARVLQEKHEGQNGEDITIDYSHDDSPSKDYDKKIITQNGDTTTIEYFKNGSIKSKTEGGKTISYTYDNNGNTKNIVDQSGTVTSYEGYNYRNQAKFVKVEGMPITEYKYYADGKIQWKINDNGTKEEYIYNNLGQIIFQYQYKEQEKFKSYEYHYDKNGNKTEEIESGKDIEIGTTKYQYDELNRVDNVVYPEGLKEQYGYDGNSNILNKFKYLSGTLLSKETYVYDYTNKLDTKNEVEYVSDLNIVQSNELTPGSNSFILTLSGNVIVEDQGQEGAYIKNTLTDEMLSKAIWSTESNDVQLATKEGKSITINIKDSIVDNGNQAIITAEWIGRRVSIVIKVKQVKSIDLSAEDNLFDKNEKVTISISGKSTNDAVLEEIILNTAIWSSSIQGVTFNKTVDAKVEVIMSEETWNTWDANQDMIITAKIGEIENSIRLTKNKKVQSILITAVDNKFDKGDIVKLSLSGLYNDGSAVETAKLNTTEWNSSIQGVTFNKKDDGTVELSMTEDAWNNWIVNDNMIITANLSEIQDNVALTKNRVVETINVEASKTLINKGENIELTITGYYNDRAMLEESILNTVECISNIAGVQFTNTSGGTVEVIMSEETWNTWDANQDMIITAKIGEIENSIRLTKNRKVQSILITAVDNKFDKGDIVKLSLSGSYNDGSSVEIDKLNTAEWNSSIQGVTFNKKDDGTVELSMTEDAWNNWIVNDNMIITAQIDQLENCVILTKNRIVESILIITLDTEFDKGETIVLTLSGLYNDGSSVEISKLNTAEWSSNMRGVTINKKANGTVEISMTEESWNAWIVNDDKTDQDMITIDKMVITANLNGINDKEILTKNRMIEKINVEASKTQFRKGEKILLSIALYYNDGSELKENILNSLKCNSNISGVQFLKFGTGEVEITMSEKAWDDWNPKEDMIITVELESFKDSINITKEYNNEVKTAEISITTDKEYYYKTDQIILKVEGFSNNGEAVPEEVLAKTVWEVQGGNQFLLDNNIGQKVICEYVISQSLTKTKNEITTQISNIEIKRPIIRKLLFTATLGKLKATKEVDVLMGYTFKSEQDDDILLENSQTTTSQGIKLNSNNIDSNEKKNNLEEVIVRNTNKAKALEQLETIKATTDSSITLNIEEPKSDEKSEPEESQNNQPKIKVTEYHYDNNGNLIDEIVNGASIKSYGYNNLNQLIDFQDKINNITATYTYYPQGLRKSKTVTGITNSQLNGTTSFHYSGDNVIMEEKGNELLSRYTIGLSYIRRIDSKNNKYYYLFDAHGDVTVVTDESGQVVKSYDYDIYGKAKSVVEDNDLVGQEFYNPIRYTGQYFDEESGMYYLRARYYSPEIMRFISEDTYKGSLSNPLSLNYYMYCWGNPVMLYDPSGHRPHRKSKPSAYSRSNQEFMREIRNIQREAFENGGDDVVSIIAGFTPADVFIDGAGLITGKDIITGDDSSRLILFACLFLPEVGDQFLKNGKKGYKVLEGASEADFYVGKNGKVLQAKYKEWIGTNRGQELLNSANNSKLKNAIKQLYRGKSFIGDGGTADVLRFERSTGINLGRNGNSHIQKVGDMQRYLQKIIDTENLNASDIKLANELLNNLKNALGGN